MYDRAPSSPEVSEPATIRLTRDEHDRLTDGRHTFWRDPDHNRIRWSRHVKQGHWPDDGLGIAGHGSASTLEGAVAMAHRCERLRIEAKEPKP